MAKQLQREDCSDVNSTQLYFFKWGR